MSNAISMFLNDMGFVSGNVITVDNVCAIFILLLGMSFIGELINSVIGGLRK